MSTSDFKARQLTVEEFNSKSKFKKRGIVAIPTKFGIAFGARFLNQAGALVHVYNDGSVLVSHGGTEMGQGLHTKMIQVTARALGVPISKVHISETNTMAVANTSATAASASSGKKQWLSVRRVTKNSLFVPHIDLNGMAIIDACNQILERLKPVRAKKPPTATWDEIVWAAYFDRINLSANGFYKTPNIDYDWENNKGRNYNYFTYGTVATEVEIDVLTGDHTVLVNFESGGG